MERFFVKKTTVSEHGIAMWVSDHLAAMKKEIARERQALVPRIEELEGMMSEIMAIPEVETPSRDGSENITTAVRDAIAALNAEISELQGKLQGEQGRNRSLGEQVDALTAELEIEKAEVKVKCKDCNRLEAFEENSKLRDQVAALTAKMKAYFIAAEYQNVDKLLLGSEEMYAKIGKVAVERIKAIITDRDTAISMLEDAEGRVKIQTAELRNRADLYLRTNENHLKTIETQSKQFAALTAENEKLKEETVCVNCHNALEEKIAILTAENSALREQNSAMNASLVTLREKIERLKTDMQSIYDDAQRFLGYDGRCSKEPLHRVVSINKVAERWAWRTFSLKQAGPGGE